MGGKMRGERIERPLNQIIVSDIGRRVTKPREPGRALPIVGEKAMDITADDPAIRRNRAVRRSIGKPRKRPRAIGAVRYSHMHFVAAHRRAVAGMPLHRLKAFLLRQRRCEIEKSKAFDAGRRTFHPSRI